MTAHSCTANAVTLALLILTSAAAAALGAPGLPDFDFTQPGATSGWHAVHDLTAFRQTPEGLAFSIAGPDPYLHGPRRDYLSETPMWLKLRLRSQQGGTGQIFYFRDHPTESRSVHFRVRAGGWQEVSVALPPLEAGTALRLDPPGDGGEVVLSSLRFLPRRFFPEPRWAEWPRPAANPERSLKAGALTLSPGQRHLFGFEVLVEGERMAFAHPVPRFAYRAGDSARWTEVPSSNAVARWPEPGVCELTAKWSDPEGAGWSYQQRITAGEGDSFQIETTLSVEVEREILFAPMVLLLPGEQSFGRQKGQALFAGLEYLENEPSSSEADIIGPESKRQVPAAHKITFPLMAIQAGQRYVGLIWDPRTELSAVFDSPDRLFGSGGHAMGLLVPGSTGSNREEGRLLPFAGHSVQAGQRLTARGLIIGGRGSSVVPAVEQYVRRRGLPPLPQTKLNAQAYFTLAAKGWLDSRGREGNLYRHAYWPGFAPQPAADAALLELWLAERTEDATLGMRLREAATNALRAVGARPYLQASVSHIHTPAPTLVFGPIAESIRAARHQARNLAERFAADGNIPYRRSADKPDYSRTHFTNQANGLTAQVVMSLLEAAAFAGDTELISNAVARLRDLSAFRGTVPRGAQTWEVPLHTPDILAAAHLVRAYVIGYELTGDGEFLKQAIEWAWTGVPFVYLVNPTGQEVGLYSTIPVLGATSWRAPVWFGRPVQWCGLVYGESLHRLAEHDSTGPWRRIADGITAAGLQHTWREDDAQRVGLLPDYYELLPQQRDGPAINPGTVAFGASRFFQQGSLYDFHAFRRHHVLVHAPGPIEQPAESAAQVSFRVRGAVADYHVLLLGLRKKPLVRVEEQPGPEEGLVEFLDDEKAAVLRLRGSRTVHLRLN